MPQTIPDPFGEGGPDTYTVPREYYVDPDLSPDPEKRQYQTVAAALAAANSAAHDPVVVRLSSGKTHSWDGSGLSAAWIKLYSHTTRGGVLASLEFANLASVVSSGVLVLEGLSFSFLGAAELGVNTLHVSRCSGEWRWALVNSGSSPQDHRVNFSDFLEDFALTHDAGLTDAGRLVFNSCRILSAESIWDESASTAAWWVEFDMCQLTATDTGSPVVLFQGSGNSDGLAFRGTELLLSPTDVMTLADTMSPYWTSCRILMNVVDFKFIGVWSFGALGSQTDLYIEVTGQLLPTDAPDGTRGRSPTLLSSGGELLGVLTFSAALGQWRGPNNSVVLAGATLSSNGAPVRLTTAAETHEHVLFSAAGIPRTLSVTGRVIAARISAEEAAAWDVDTIFVVNPASVTHTFLFRYGALPSKLFEDNLGQFELALHPVLRLYVDSSPVVEDFIINGVTLSATSGARTPGSDDFDGSLATGALIAAEMADAINDGANSFVGVCTAAADGNILTIYGEGGVNLVIEESPDSSSVYLDNAGLALSVVRNSGSGIVELGGFLQCVEPGMYP